MTSWGDVRSKEDLVSGAGEYHPPLPGQEDYLARIAEIRDINKPNFDGVLQDFKSVRFEIQSFADKQPLEDINGDSVESGRPITRDFDPDRLGFMKNGTASLTRQFLFAASGSNDFEGQLPMVEDATLIGKDVIVSLAVYTSSRDGKQRNKVTAVKATGGRRGRKAVDPLFEQQAAELAK